MLDFLIDNIFAIFGEAIFQQVGIPMGTNCASLLADLLLTKFLQNMGKHKNIYPLTSHTDVLTMYCPSTTLATFDKWLPSIYPQELEVKETTSGI